MTQEDDLHPVKLEFGSGYSQEQQQFYNSHSSGLLHPGQYSPTHPDPHPFPQNSHHHHLHHSSSPSFNPSSSPPRKHKQHVFRVDTIITDSNGNTSRYDSSDQLSNITAGSNSGVNVNGNSNNKSALGVFNTHSDFGEKTSTGGGSYHTNHSGSNINNTPTTPSGCGMTAGGGGHKRSSTGKSASGSSPTTSTPLGVATSSSKSGSTLGRRLSSASSSHSSHSLGSQESAHPHPPTVMDPTVAALQAAGQAGHHARAASFRAPKGTVKSELKVEEGVMGYVRRNSMPNVCNNLLNVPGTSGSSSSGGDASPDGKDTRIRRVRSFKTTSKGAVVNRGDSFKKKSTHSLMSTGSTVTDNEARARFGSGNNNSLLKTQYGRGEDGGAGAPAYFRVYLMGDAGVGKTSLAIQFLTSENVDHDDGGESAQYFVCVFFLSLTASALFGVMYALNAIRFLFLYDPLESKGQKQ
ncbi:vitellogenin-1-like [Littorina saxatilis]|uniref:vitellogenin-1-like n=1 Tax=Littorina saxatilis TaxID=31220 RepID=UPI0038B42AF9